MWRVFGIDDTQTGPPTCCWFWRQNEFAVVRISVDLQWKSSYATRTTGATSKRTRVKLLVSPQTLRPHMQQQTIMHNFCTFAIVARDLSIGPISAYFADKVSKLMELSPAKRPDFAGISRKITWLCFWDRNASVLSLTTHYLRWQNTWYSEKREHQYFLLSPSTDRWLSTIGPVHKHEMYWVRKCINRCKNCNISRNFAEKCRRRPRLNSRNRLCPCDSSWCNLLEWRCERLIALTIHRDAGRSCFAIFALVAVFCTLHLAAGRVYRYFVYI